MHFSSTAGVESPPVATCQKEGDTVNVSSSDYKQSGYLWQDVLHALYIDVLAMENCVCQSGISVPVLNNAERNVAIC